MNYLFKANSYKLPKKFKYVIIVIYYSISIDIHDNDWCSDELIFIILYVDELQKQQQSFVNLHEFTLEKNTVICNAMYSSPYVLHF